MFKEIVGNYLIVDCVSCKGMGRIIAIDSDKSNKIDCPLCNGACVVRIPIDELPIAHLGKKALSVYEKEK